MTIAVTGATGYLGTHMILCLQDRGDDVAGFTTESRRPFALGKTAACHPFVIGQPEPLAEQFRAENITSIIHFAGDGTVPSSIIDPLREYNRSLGTTLTILTAAKMANIERLVFSSTASVYGIPERMPIHEDTPLNPISPNGAAMAMAERIVSDVCRPACIATATLRYFNVAGADPQGRAGEGGRPRHLIKAAAQIATGILKKPLKIYGEDYDTPDGTAIRDYIHVADMADAHASALDYLVQNGEHITVNCGYGEGASVREVINAVEHVTGRPLPTKSAPRRAGDPPLLIADNAAIRSKFAWSPRYNDINTIVRTAIEWEQNTPGSAAA